MGYGARGIGACPRPTCTTWLSPRRSMWTGLWPGSPSAHEPRRGSPALPPWPLRPWAIQARQPPKLLAAPPHSNPCCTASLTHILYYKNIYCSRLIEKSLIADVGADRKLLLGKQHCLLWSHPLRTLAWYNKNLSQDSPTVIHEPKLSTAYENREAIFRRIAHEFGTHHDP